jgi:hypothetical protein
MTTLRKGLEKPPRKIFPTPTEYAEQRVKNKDFHSGRVVPPFFENCYNTLRERLSVTRQFFKSSASSWLTGIDGEWIARSNAISAADSL